MPKIPAANRHIKSRVANIVFITRLKTPNWASDCWLWRDDNPDALRVCRLMAGSAVATLDTWCLSGCTGQVWAATTTPSRWASITWCGLGNYFLIFFTLVSISPEMWFFHPSSSHSLPVTPLAKERYKGESKADTGQDKLWLVWQLRLPCQLMQLQPSSSN